MSENKTQALTKAPPQGEVALKKEATDFLNSEKVKEALAQIGSKHATPDRLARVAITAVMGKPQLVQAAAHPAGRASLLNALMRCTQMGLEPDGRLAHLIPFWNKNAGCYEVQLIADYKGLLQLAKDNGIDAKAVLVHANDAFEYIEDDGDGKTVVHHKFDPFTDRGEIIGVYSRAKEGDKAPDYEFMSIMEVEAIRARSRAGNEGPWKTDYGEMVKKTVTRRHSKRWPLRPEVREAFTIDDDTPPPFNQTQVAAPIFKRKTPEKQLEEGKGKPEPTSEQESANAQADAEAAAEGQSETPEAPSLDLVKTLEKICKAKKVKEEEVIAYLVGMGLVEGVTDFTQLVADVPDIARQVISDFDEVVTAILENRKKA